jgi:site-specific DNA-methyltransferase (adenine-specific)
MSDYDAAHDSREGYEVGIAEIRRRKIAAGEIVPWVRREVIGDATLYLGDSLEILPHIEATVDAVFTDPPYSSGGMVRGDRMGKTSAKYQSTKYRQLYAEFSGDNRDQRSFGYWSALWLGAALRVTRPGGLCLLFTDWRQLPTTTDALQAGGWCWRGLAVWDKTEAARPQKGRYRNQSEYMVWGSAGPLREDGPCAPGVFRYSVNSEEKHHIAGKPVQLFCDLLQLTEPGETVLDPFMGSGSAGIGCVRLGRKYIGIEMVPQHFDTACRRIEEEHRSADLFIEHAKRQKPESIDLFGSAAE